MLAHGLFKQRRVLVLLHRLRISDGLVVVSRGLYASMD